MGVAVAVAVDVVVVVAAAVAVAGVVGVWAISLGFVASIEWVGLGRDRRREAW